MTLASLAEVFAALEGRWRQERTITPGGAYVGTAEFTRLSADELAYHEDGVLTLTGGFTGAAYRDYLYRLEEDVIAVYFAERPRRLFHRIVLANGTIETAFHACDPDDYSTSYRFLGPTEFEVIHEVRGPRKDYVMATRYLKI